MSDGEAGQAAPGGPSRPCPGCGGTAKQGQDSPWRPFCSERCKMADLGNWLGERYRIPGPPADSFIEPDPDEG